MDIEREFGLKHDEIYEMFYSHTYSCYKCMGDRIQIQKYRIPFEEQMKHPLAKDTDTFLFCWPCEKYTNRPDIVIELQKTG